MKKVTVTNKKELEAAVKSSADIIVVTGDLAKKIKKHKIIFKQDPKKTKILIGATTGACATMIATAVATAATAPGTAGLSALIGGPAFLAEAGIAAASTGLSITVIVALVAVCVLIGTTVLIELLKSYDLVESSVKIGKDGIEFHKKYNPKSSKKKKTSEED